MVMVVVAVGLWLLDKGGSGKGWEVMVKRWELGVWLLLSSLELGVAIMGE